MLKGELNQDVFLSEGSTSASQKYQKTETLTLLKPARTAKLHLTIGINRLTNKHPANFEY